MILLQDILLFWFSHTIAQKPSSTIRRLLFCYKRFQTVTQASQKKPICFFSVEQVGFNHWNRNKDSLKTKWKHFEKHNLERNIKKRQNFQQNFYNAPDFEMKILQRVIFCRMFFSTWQNWTWNFFNAPDFEQHFLDCIRIWHENFETCQILTSKKTMRKLLSLKKYNVCNLRMIFC